MKEQALTYVRLALSRNLTLKNVVFSPDADGLRELVKTCASAYNIAPNSEEAFSANEAKGPRSASWRAILKRRRP